MKILYKSLLVLAVVAMATSCIEGKKENSADISNNTTQASQSNSKKDIDIARIKEKLCNEFPKELVLGYNPHFKKIHIEPVDNGSGGILHCNVHMFYGEKEHEYFKGQVAAAINNQKDPFWQYDPKKNPANYQEVKGLGDRAVFIANMRQLQILKDGVLYFITPPSRGKTTESGKENKEIAIEIAEHFNL